MLYSGRNQVKEPNPHLIDRNMDPALEPRIAAIGDLVERCVNYGTHLIPEFDENARHKNVLPAILLGLHAVETLDAIGVLISHCCADPAKALLRGQMEALFAIQYMAKEHSERRAIQYLVGHAHARLSWYEKIDPTAEQGKQLRAQLKKDAMLADLDLVSRDTTAEARNARALIALPEYAEVEREWQKTRKKVKGSIWWYSLFDGPANIEGLAQEVGEYALYQVLYRIYSTESHATNAIESLHVTLDNKPVIQPLRYPHSIPMTAVHAIATALRTFRVLIGMLGPQLMESYELWYTNEIQGDFMKLLSFRITDGNRALREPARRGNPD